MSKIEQGPMVSGSDNLEPNLGNIESVKAKENLDGRNQPENSPKDLNDRVENLEDMAKSDRKEFDTAREELALPPSNEKLATEGDLEKMQSEQEKERLIKEEKEKILQEKINDFFSELESLVPKDLKAALKNGMESNVLGQIDKKTVKILIEAFEEGIKLLPQILEKLPDLFEMLDEELTQEAIKRVEERLEDDKKDDNNEKEELEPSEEKNPELGSRKVSINENDSI